MASPQPAYRRILLKLSGESLLGGAAFGIDFERARSIAREIKDVRALGVQVAVMIGGGNIFRGFRGTEAGMDRTAADQMGLLATVINGIALQEALEKEGLQTRHVSAIEIKALAEPFIRRRVIRHLEKDRVVVFSAGIGSPYFTTDTAAALRAVEVGADVVLKATRVAGIYDRDPLAGPGATFYPRITYQEILERGLAVMDMTAITMLKENRLPLVVFDVGQRGNLLKLAQGETLGTSVTE